MSIFRRLEEFGELKLLKLEGKNRMIDLTAEKLRDEGRKGASSTTYPSSDDPEKRERRAAARKARKSERANKAAENARQTATHDHGKTIPNTPK